MKPPDDVHKVIESRKPSPAGRSEVREISKPDKGTEIAQDRRVEIANFAENNMNLKKSYVRHTESFAQNVVRRITSVPFVEHNLNCSEWQASDEAEVQLALQRKEEVFPKKFYARLDVGKSIIEFQLDSGASVNVLPEEVYLAEFGQSTHMKPPEATF